MSSLTFGERTLNRFHYCRTLFFGRRRIRLANTTPLISFTFDDFPRSALYAGGGILQEHGLAATYYTALGLMNTEGPVGRIFSEEDLPKVLSQRHELGCHTFDHLDTWNTDPKTFEASVLRNRQALNRLLPGVSFLSHSYPRSSPQPRTKQAIEKYFQCCRGGSGQTFNSGTVDLNFLRAFFLEKSNRDLNAAKALIDRNCQRGGWLIIATHDIAENPTPFGCTPAFFADIVRYAVGSGATILPVAAALKKILGPNEYLGENKVSGD